MSNLINDSLTIQHYLHYWGDYQNVYEINHAPSVFKRPLRIVEFSPESEDQDWVYATVGMSSKSMPYPDSWVGERSENRAELFIYSREKNEKIIDVLVPLSEYPFIHNTFLGVGHTVPGRTGIGGNAALTDILVLRPMGEEPEFEIIHQAPDIHVQMLWLVPIYDSERLFIKKKGWNSLVDIFFEKRTETSDFSRKRVV